MKEISKMARKDYAHLQKTPTKDWDFATIRLPKDLMEKIRKDAIKYLRLAIDLNPILFFSMINYLLSKSITRINRSFSPKKTGLPLIYSTVNREINRQLGEVNFE